MNAGRIQVALESKAIATPDVVRKYNKLKEVQAQIAELIVQEVHLKEFLIESIGRHDVMLNTRSVPLYTYKYEGQFSFQFKKLQTDYPEVYKMYALVEPMRKLRIK